MVTNHPLNTKEYERILCYRENLVLAVPRKYIMDSSLLSRKLSLRELGNKIFSISMNDVFHRQNLAKSLLFFYTTETI